MRTTQRHRRAGWLAWILALAISSASAQVPKAEVDVTDVGVARFVVSMADVLKVNVITALPLYERGSFKLAFDGAPQWLEQQAVAAGRQLAYAPGNIALLGSTCQQAAPPSDRITPPGLVGTERSLHFQSVPLAVLVDLLGLHLDEGDALTMAYASRPLSIHVAAASASDILNAAAMAAGVEIKLGQSGQLRFLRAKGITCPLPDLSERWNDEDHLQQKKPPVHHCPYRAPQEDQKQRRCDLLEFYSMRSLVAKGRVTIKGRHMAILESLSDGLMFVVRPGDYMGRHFGKVMAITPAGLTLREIFQDDTGLWQEGAAVMPFGARYEPRKEVRNHFYVEDGSPQHRYNKTVNTLFFIWQSVQNTQRLCAAHHPTWASAIETAVANWTTQHSGTGELIAAHSLAYAERMAEDYVTTTKLVMQLATENTERYLRQSLSIMGDPQDTSIGRYCQAFPALLMGDALKLETRFDKELRWLNDCREDSTCPNLR